jgi:hypothetical protein
MTTSTTRPIGSVESMIFARLHPLRPHASSLRTLNNPRPALDIDRLRSVVRHVSAAAAVHALPGPVGGEPACEGVSER